MARSITIHFDGSCLKNPGPGGWAAHIAGMSAEPIELVGGEPNTTNNRMELKALIASLETMAKARADDKILLRGDSEYCLKGMNEWLAGWKRKGFRKADGKPVINEDLWRIVDHRLQAVSGAGVTFRTEWVKGHSGDPGNERVDELARAEATRIRDGGAPKAPAPVVAPREPQPAAKALPAVSAAPGMRPMDEAPRDGTPILVKIREDLFAMTGRAEAVAWQGRAAVLSFVPEGWRFDFPKGNMLWPESYLEGFVDLPDAFLRNAPDARTEGIAEPVY